MDPQEENQCVEDPLKYPKHHSGLMSMAKTPEMPKLLLKNSRLILEGIS